MENMIQLTDKIPAGASFAVLAGGDRKLTTPMLTVREKAYVNGLREVDPEKGFVVIQRLEQQVVVVFLRKESLMDTLELCRRDGSKLADHFSGHKLESVWLAAAGVGFEALNALAEGLLLAGYRFRRYFSPEKREKESFSLRKIYMVHNQPDVQLMARTMAGVRSTFMARDLVNEPPSAFSATQFAALLAEHAAATGIKTEVFNKPRIEALKMGGLLAVNRGSIDPPSFTVLDWNPSEATHVKPLVLVGKGVLFDTGGMNLKVGNFMDGMKSDMAGAAVMAAVMIAVAELKVPLRVIALIPATDNRVNGNALLPGDVITMHDGTTVEVKNTDAEGRLILADAISYARRYDPALIIDVATLTGAAMRAIGHHGIVGMHQGAPSWMELLKQSGEYCYERIAEFPMWKEYEEGLQSDIADLSNLGGVNGGAIIAGKFLAHFAKAPLIHLDIAGPAFIDKREHYLPKGGTGMGVRLLLHFIQQYQNRLLSEENKHTLKS